MPFIIAITPDGDTLHGLCFPDDARLTADGDEIQFGGGEFGTGCPVGTTLSVVGSRPDGLRLAGVWAHWSVDGIGTVRYPAHRRDRVDALKTLAAGAADVKAGDLDDVSDAAGLKRATGAKAAKVARLKPAALAALDRMRV
jgi:hypothetical protein